MSPQSLPADRRPVEGLAAALEQLDEQITTIVVIDDNPHDNRLIRRLLQSYKHYRVFEAYAGRDGLDLVRQWQPDLVVLDLTLPDMDGFSVLAALKADQATQATPIVVISAKSLTPHEEEYLQRYTDSVWQKGNFSARELVSHVVKVLRDDATELEAILPHAGRVASFGQDRRSRILIIEDNVWESRLMRRLLESRQHFEVTEAYSAADALATVGQIPPDLVILDLLLPDATGEQLLGRLQSLGARPQIPIIVITAKDLEPNERACLAPRVDSIWTKGNLDRSTLLAHIETILGE